MSIDYGNTPPRAGQQSPWDGIDHVKEEAPGIVWVSTPGHGGFWISDARRAAMPVQIRDIQTFAHGNWYEEDCDWALVVLAFPTLFTKQTAVYALVMAKHLNSGLNIPDAALEPARAWAAEAIEAEAADRSEQRLRLMEGGL